MINTLVAPVHVEQVLPDLRLLHGALTSSEVEQLTDRLEARGFEETGLLYPPSYRTNLRCVFDDPELADQLFARLRPHLPPVVRTPDGARWELAGLNPRFRACRYSGGQAFKIHRDGAQQPAPSVRSFRTVMLYLDSADQFEGGGTRFFADRTGAEVLTRVAPRAGTAAVFAHDLWHDGAPVTRGVKRVFRTDVFYERAEGAGKAEGHTGYVWCLQPLPDGRLASGSRDATIAIGKPGGPVTLLRGHTASVTSLAFSGGVLWSGSRDGTLRRWREGEALGSDRVVRGGLRPPRSPRRLLAALTRPPAKLGAPAGAPLGVDLGGGVVLALAPRQNGGVVAATADGRLRWRGPLGEDEGALDAHPCWAWDVVALGEGRFASAGEDGWVRVWSDRRCALGFKAAAGPVQALLSVPGGGLVTGSFEGAIRTWDAGGGLTSERVAHTAAVAALARLPDGVVVSAGEDDKVVIDGPEGPKVWVHGDFVRALAVTADGRLVSGSYDATVRVHSR